MIGEKRENGTNTIRLMTRDDLRGVSEAHISAFPDSLITRLGIAAVERYYLWQLEGPHSHYPIVATIDERVVGFCVGGISRGSLRGYLKKNWMFLACRTVLNPGLFLNGRFFRRAGTVLKSLFGREKRPLGPACGETAGPNSFGILAICVIPSVKGSGVAREIMEESESEARKRGFSRMHLTVASDNGRAIRFYEKLGYVIKESDNPTGGTYMEKELK
ncbi:MAG TPA: GNAT family N-acetyltransferase [Acidobacteriota bacterium]|nr:GNAT family N-acetyltransferase [Acidobacteriota bacterium]